MPPLHIQLPPEISRNELALHGMADFGDLERPLPRTDIGMQRLRAWAEGMHEHWFLPKGGIDFEVAVDKKLWAAGDFYDNESCFFSNRYNGHLHTLLSSPHAMAVKVWQVRPDITMGFGRGWSIKYQDCECRHFNNIYSAGGRDNHLMAFLYGLSQNLPVVGLKTTPSTPNHRSFYFNTHGYRVGPADCPAKHAYVDLRPADPKELFPCQGSECTAQRTFEELHITQDGLLCSACAHICLWCGQGSLKAQAHLILKNLNVEGDMESLCHPCFLNAERCWKCKTLFNKIQSYVTIDSQSSPVCYKCKKKCGVCHSEYGGRYCPCVKTNEPLRLTTVYATYNLMDSISSKIRTRSDDKRKHTVRTASPVAQEPGNF